MDVSLLTLICNFTSAKQASFPEERRKAWAPITAKPVEAISSIASPVLIPLTCLSCFSLLVLELADTHVSTGHIHQATSGEARSFPDEDHQAANGLPNHFGRSKFTPRFLISNFISFLFYHAGLSADPSQANTAAAMGSLPNSLTTNQAGHSAAAHSPKLMYTPPTSAKIVIEFSP